MQFSTKLKMSLMSFFLLSSVAVEASDASSGSLLAAVQNNPVSKQAPVSIQTRMEPNLSASNVFFVEGEYLFWNAHEVGLSYANVLSGIAPPTVGTLSEKNLKFDWDSGFRVGIGYRTPWDAWELGLRWTRLYSHAHGKTLTQSEPDAQGNVLFTPWIPSLHFAQATSPLTIWSNLAIHLNVVDFDISRFFPVTSYLSIKPHVGARGLFVHQKYTVSSTGGTSLGYVGLLSAANMNMHSQCSGGGLRIAVDTEWEFAKGWSFYGNIGGSLLCTNFNLRQQLQFLDVPGEISSNGYLKNHIHTTVLPTVDLSLGFGWNHSFNDKAALSIRAGWELNDFGKQNKMSSFDTTALTDTLTSYSEDLTYQGLTASVRLDF